MTEETLMLYIFAAEEGQLGYANVIFCYVVSFLLCIGGGRVEVTVAAWQLTSTSFCCCY